MYTIKPLSNVLLILRITQAHNVPQATNHDRRLRLHGALPQVVTTSAHKSKLQAQQSA
jgi:hypothetical protein